ncbi:MAG: hypothetical protein CMF96_06140 [Candidatus Marinimicrobia bacterium]|nr:hypothetical protein [Candidatus Neomarinimicrobiota bacterium]|tara:strand:+ start:328 stop:1098 length:771 start_codon:yes stop_codon:yes gene_type:complete
MNKNNDRKIGFLDWGLTFAFIILGLAIYIPDSIDREESYYKNESRHRMEVIYSAEELFYELTGNYTLDGKELFKVVQQARDSLMGDSLFYGDKVIHIDGNPKVFKIPRDLQMIVDTTFSSEEILKKQVTDFVYSVGIQNEESGIVDTIYVNSQNIENIRQNQNYVGEYGVDTTSHIEVYSDYKRKGFRLDFELLKCPLTGNYYKIEIDNSDIENPILSITSPVPLNYSEPRFLYLYRFKADDHGMISGGIKSWKST